MGESGWMKRVNSRKAPRQAWFRVSAPRMPAVPTDLSGIHTSALTASWVRTPLAGTALSRRPSSGRHRDGGGQGSLSVRGAEVRMGRRSEKRLEAITESKGLGLGQRLSQPGRARDGGSPLFTRSGAPKASPLWSATSAAPARGQQGRSWGGEGVPTAGGPGPRKIVSALAERGTGGGGGAD